MTVNVVPACSHRESQRHTWHCQLHTSGCRSLYSRRQPVLLVALPGGSAARPSLRMRSLSCPRRRCSCCSRGPRCAGAPGRSDAGRRRPRTSAVVDGAADARSRRPAPSRRSRTCRSSPATACAPTTGRVEVALPGRQRCSTSTRLHRSTCSRPTALRLTAGTRDARRRRRRRSGSGRRAIRSTRRRRRRSTDGPASTASRSSPTRTSAANRARGRPRVGGARHRARHRCRSRPASERRAQRRGAVDAAALQLGALRRVRPLVATRSGRARRRGVRRSTCRRISRCTAARSISTARGDYDRAVRLRLVSARRGRRGGRTTTATGRRRGRTAGRGSAPTAWAWPTHHYGRWGFARNALVLDSRAARGGRRGCRGRSAPGYVSWCPLGFDNRPVFALSFGVAVVRRRTGWVDRPAHGVRRYAAYRDPTATRSTASSRSDAAVARQRVDAAPSPRSRRRGSGRGRTSPCRRECRQAGASAAQSTAPRGRLPTVAATSPAGSRPRRAAARRGGPDAREATRADFAGRGASARPARRARRLTARSARQRAAAQRSPHATSAAAQSALAPACPRSGSARVTTAPPCRARPRRRPGVRARAGARPRRAPAAVAPRCRRTPPEPAAAAAAAPPSSRSPRERDAGAGERRRRGGRPPRAGAPRADAGAASASARAAAARRRRSAASGGRAAPAVARSATPRTADAGAVAVDSRWSAKSTAH